MQITINLATRPFVDLRPPLNFLKRALIVLGCVNVFVGLLVYLALSSKNSSRAQAHALDKIVAAQSEELANYRRGIQRPENVLLSDRTNALNQLFDEKAFSWTRLMMNLEGDVPAEVQLESIQPVREKDGSMNLRFHVTGPRGRIIELLANLEKTPCFITPRVLGENAQEDPGAKAPPHPLNEMSVEEFEVEAGYDESQAAVKTQINTSGGEQPADMNQASGKADASIARGGK
jgi:type IV pilus assembly protein PilN